MMFQMISEHRFKKNIWMDEGIQQLKCNENYILLIQLICALVFASNE